MTLPPDALGHPAVSNGLGSRPRTTITSSTPNRCISRLPFLKPIGQQATSAAQRPNTGRHAHGQQAVADDQHGLLSAGLRRRTAWRAPAMGSTSTAVSSSISSGTR